MEEEKRCGECMYYRVEPEYWHDHYRIPEHHFCIYKPEVLYRYKEVDPLKDTCENFQRSKGDGK